jgi:hypothetical protein
MGQQHPLYTQALQADEHLTAVLKAKTGRDRWTMQANDYKIPEVADALRAKYAADDAWLNAIRQSRVAYRY